MAWVDAETVTTLIAGHGADRGAVLRPAWGGVPGWPVLVPMSAVDVLASLDAHRMPDELIDDLEAAGIAVRLIESGDPGTTHDLSTARAALPPYDGPPEPADQHAHEWGAAVAEDPDDLAPEGPEQIPYPAPRD